MQSELSPSRKAEADFDAEDSGWEEGCLHGSSPAQDCEVEKRKRTGGGWTRKGEKKDKEEEEGGRVDGKGELTISCQLDTSDISTDGESLN